MATAVTDVTTAKRRNATAEHRVGWAINFYRDAFDTTRPQLMGRHVAGEGFLNAVIRHASTDHFHCLTSSENAFCQFSNWVSIAGRGQKAARWVTPDCLANLSEAGCLYHPAMGLGKLAWQRRSVGQRRYSIVGVTHTMCTQRAMDALGDMYTAPVQPWDALVCTSQTAKRSVDHILGEWGEYLSIRMGGRPQCGALLPIIPLGVDCDRFEKLRGDREARDEVRREWQIAPEEVVFLYVGRLSVHAKANPLPMYRALEAAATRTNKKVRLLLAGRFGNKAIEQAFRNGCATYCPHVVVAHRDGRKKEDLEKAWQVADAFTLLADNVQETFGLAPIEAMAVGLPVVVSDWDGFRDTVRHGVDGFRIATMMPAAGAGIELVRRYAEEIDTYDRYVGNVSQAIVVDQTQATEAYCRLIEDDGLRQRMGESGQRRARELFDWPVIVRQYEELFVEVNARRRSAKEHAPTQPERSICPLRDDPFAVFAGYPTGTLDQETVFSAVGETSPSTLEGLLADPLANLGRERVCARHDVEAVLSDLTEPRTAGEIVDGPLAHLPKSSAWRAIAWIVKLGLVRGDLPSIDNGPTSETCEVTSTSQTY